MQAKNRTCEAGANSRADAVQQAGRMVLPVVRRLIRQSRRAGMRDEGRDACAEP